MHNPNKQRKTALQPNKPPQTQGLPQRKGLGPKNAVGDRKKPRLSLIPKEALWQLGDALTVGEYKYSTHSWKKGIEISYSIDAALRHIQQFNSGENTDDETKCTHLGSALANLSFAIWTLEHRPDLDDRYKNSKESDE